MKDELWVCQLGLTAYREALALQERLAAARRAGTVPNTMLLLEHPSVLTRGRRSGAEDLPLPLEWYRDRGIEVVDVNRGGKLTYHGPGQLVGYPIVQATDVVAYIRVLEGSLIHALAEHGVDARSRPDDGIAYTGVWVEDRKIASVGVHLSHGVTTHGFALNVVNDMEPWSWFTACGLPTVEMTSVADELARVGGECPADLLRCLRKRTGVAVAEGLGLRQRLISRARLERVLDGELPAGGRPAARTAAGRPPRGPAG